MESSGDERLPRHRQVEAILRARLAAGDPPVGARLPREVDLAAMLGVSRSVVRQALTVLERDGLLQRRRRGGTHVLRATPAPVVQELAGVYGLAQGSLAARVESRLLAWALAPTDEATAALDADGQGQVLAAERLRLVDGQPLALEALALPAAVAAVLPPTALAEGSLYAHLAAGGWPAVRAEEEVAAVQLDGRAGRLLEQPAGAPALLVTRQTFGPAGAIEHRRTLYRADRYRLRVELSGPLLDRPGAEPAQRRADRTRRG